MLAWILTLPYLALGSFDSEVAKRDSSEFFHNDAMMVILAKVGFASLYQASYASREFRTIADRAIKAFYCTRPGGVSCLNYSKIVRELDFLVQDTGKDGQITQANLALKASPHFRCMQLILEARFGCCIRYAAGKLLALCLYDLPVDILNEPHKISIVPYVIDHGTMGARWISLVRGLVDLKRVDLLDQLQFPKITNKQFYELMSTSLPESVLSVAIESLLANGANPGLSSFLTWSGFGGQAAS